MDEERRAVLELLNSDFCKNKMNENIERISKTNEVAVNVRQLGNTRLKEVRHASDLHENVVQLYSLSIAIARNNSEELAIAYGNRSAMMIHLFKYEDCIKDIDRAMKITKSAVLKIKLLCRKAKCLNALGSHHEKKIAMHKAETLLKEIGDNSLKKSFEDLVNKAKLAINGPVKKKTAITDQKSVLLEALREKHVVNDFSSVVIQYNKKYGRHLVANRDIKPGEIIYIEQPYIHCLSLDKGHVFCFHCLKVSLTNIPCEHCSWAMYCSENCKKDAWTKYHDLECSVYAMAKESDPDDGYKHLAVKALICGIREAGGIEKFKAELQAFDTCTDNTKGFVKDGKIQSDGFKSMYALTHKVSDKNVTLHTKNTAWVLRSVSRNTTFFGGRSDYEKTQSFRQDENVIYLGSLILRLSKISQLNSRIIPSFQTRCSNNLDVRLCRKKKCCISGVYIAPITSLMNHSCDPNAKTCLSNDYSVIVYAVQPIKKGAQIFDCYQQEFYEYDLKPRLKQLTRTYNFHCDCIACQEKWDIVQYEVISKKTLRKNAAESQLMDQYLHLIQSIRKKKIELSEKHIRILTTGIEKAFATLTQPSFITYNLIRCMNIVYTSLYGIEVDIPDKCNDV